ncbi:hypothetical protein SAMN05216345_112109 [Cupriavidus sp. YR651]|nr:hypothetical protein SAMN05216345_112109 [Cupriavidus sp. YR651]
MRLTEVASNHSLKVSARLEFLFEVQLPLCERAPDRLANKLLFGREVEIECAVGQAGRSHDPADARSRDSLSAEAFRGDLEDMLPSRGFVTFFETHLLSTRVSRPSVCGRLQQGPEVAIKLMSHGIDLLAAELAKNGGWSIIFKPDTTIAILAQQYTDGCMESRRQLMAGHLRCGERIADIVLDGSARQPGNSRG